MGVVVFLVAVVVLVGVVALFARAVFGGSTFKAERRRDRATPVGPPGLPPDAHAGSRRWPGGGSIGTHGQWGVGGGTGGGDSSS